MVNSLPGTLCIWKPNTIASCSLLTPLCCKEFEKEIIASFSQSKCYGMKPEIIISSSRSKCCCYNLEVLKKPFARTCIPKNTFLTESKLPKAASSRIFAATWKETNSSSPIII
jgi:hypothetical protein